MKTNLFVCIILSALPFFAYPNEPSEIKEQASPWMQSKPVQFSDRANNSKTGTTQASFN